MSLRYTKMRHVSALSACKSSVTPALSLHTRVRQLERQDIGCSDFFQFIHLLHDLLLVDKTRYCLGSIGKLRDIGRLLSRRDCQSLVHDIIRDIVRDHHKLLCRDVALHTSLDQIDKILVLRVRIGDENGLSLKDFSNNFQSSGLL